MDPQKQLGLSHVRLRKDTLLKQLERNLSKHSEEYIEARKLWRIEYKEVIEKLTREMYANDDDSFEWPRTLDLSVAPVDHSEDYKQVISLLQASVDEELVITASEFAMFHDDHWKWKAQHERTYASMKSNKLR